MQVKPEQIKHTLANPKSPIRLAWLHGEDPTLIRQACNTIYASLPGLLGVQDHESGIEKHTINIDGQTDWRAIAEASVQGSLFSEVIVLELRFRTNTASAEAKAVLTEHAQRTQNTHFILVTSPRLDAKLLNSKFIKNLKDQLLLVPIWSLNTHQYQQWLTTKLAQAQITLSKEAFDWFLEASEGNLLYADQEIQKLALCFEPPTALTLDHLKEQMGYATNLNIFEIIQHLYQGNTRNLDVYLEQLRTQGEPPIKLMGAIQRELDILLSLKQAQSRGALEQGIKQARIFGPKLQAIKGALNRLNEDSMITCFNLAFEIEKSIKGVGDSSDEPSIWQLIKQLLLCIGGSQSANKTPVALY